MTERPVYPKSTCCIQGCPRWSRRFPGEWMCGRHWRMVALRCRRALRAGWHRMNEITAAVESRHPIGCTASEAHAWNRLERTNERLWGHARRTATFRDAGL